MKITWWNDSSLLIECIGGKWYILDGWNGEEYLDCWGVIDAEGYELGDSKYVIRPTYEEVEADVWEITDYRISRA